MDEAVMVFRDANKVVEDVVQAGGHARRLGYCHAGPASSIHIIIEL
jgi:hypothetical protein